MVKMTVDTLKAQRWMTFSCEGGDEPQEADMQHLSQKSVTLRNFTLVFPVDVSLNGTVVSVVLCSTLQVKKSLSVKPSAIYWFTSLTGTTGTAAGFGELQCFCLHFQSLSFELLNIFRDVSLSATAAWADLVDTCATSHVRMNRGPPEVPTSQQATLGVAHASLCGASSCKSFKIWRLFWHGTWCRITDLGALKPFSCKLASASLWKHK